MGRSIHSSEQRRLRALLVEAREKAGLTQAEVARRLRRPQSFVAKYEGNERRIDVIEFIQIAKALGADPRDLLAAVMN